MRVRVLLILAVSLDVSQQGHHRYSITISAWLNARVRRSSIKMVITILDGMKRSCVLTWCVFCGVGFSRPHCRPNIRSGCLDLVARR